MNTNQGRLSFSAGIDTSQLRRDAAESRNILASIGQTAEREGDRMDAAFGRMAKAAGGIFAIGKIAEFSKEIIRTRGEIESLEISFETLAGKTKGNALFGEIRTFAVQTPMMLKDLAKGAQTMLAFNIEAEKVMPILKAIGDVSMGNAEKFNGLVLAFSQMSATGKLMTEDLNQMIERGFNPLSIISEKTGKTIGELKEEVTAGKVSVEMVTDAFIAATSAGGKFHGMLEKQSHGINGAISNMQGAIEDALNDIGAATQGITMSAIDSATFLAKNYKELAEIIGATVLAYGTYKTCLIINEALERANIAARAEKIAAIEAEITAIGQVTSAETASLQANAAEIAAKHNLTQAEAMHIASMQAEAAARIQTLQTAVAAAEAEIMAATVAEKSARTQLLASAEILKAKEAELVAAQQSGDIFAISAAQKEVDSAATNRNAAASELNAASKAVETARAKEVAAAEAVETAGRNLNSISLDANTRKVTVLGLAKTALTKISHQLNAAIMANPYVIAAAAVGALAYGIYKLATYETEAEKEQRKFNEAVSQSKAEIEAENIKIDALFSALGDATKGTTAYENAKNAIISQYGQYLEGLVNEKGELIDVAKAYDRVKEAAENAAKARALESMEKDAQDTYQKTVAEKYSDIAEKIRGKVKNSGLADTLIQLVNNDMKDGGVMSSSTTDAIYEAFGVKRAKNGKWSMDADVRYIQQLTAEIRIAGKKLTKATHDARIEFGQAINEFEDYSLEQLRDAKKILSEDLEDSSATNFSILGGGVLMKDVDSRADGLLVLQKLNEAIRKKEKDETPTGPTQSGAGWLAAKKKAYDDALKAFNDYVETSENVSESEYIKERDRLKAELDAAKKEYDKNKPVADSKSAQQEKNANHTAVDIAERNRAIEEAKKAEIKANRDAALQVRQERLNLEEDSVDKMLKQIEIDKERMANALADREQELLEKYRDILEKQWQNENPGAKDKGLTFDRAAVTMDDMKAASAKDGNEWLKDALAAISASRTVMNETIAKQTKDAYNNMLGDVLTYEQQRLKITEEYIRKRDALYEKNEDGTFKTDSDGNKILRKGVTQGSLDELNRQETNALSAIDEQFAQREETYQAWCSSITNLTLVQLEDMLKKVEDELERMREDGDVDDNTVARFRAMKTTLQNQKKKKSAEENLSPGKRTIKEWEDLYKTLNEVEKEFENIGDTVGGVIGDIMSECGKFATSTLQIINGIKILTQSSTTAIDETGKAATQSLSTMEKASVILTIISAALQIAMQIANLFNNDAKKQEEIEHLQDRIDQLQWELDHQDIGRVQAQYGTAISRLNKALAESHAELAKGQTGWRRLVTLTSRASDNQQLMQKTAEKLAGAYSAVAYSADKALGEDRFKSASAQLKNIAQQQILLQEQINAEASKKKSDSSQIDEWKNKIEELGQQAIELINEMVEEIIGDTSTGIAEELMDAFIDAFQAGEDAAKAWGDKVNEIVGDILKRMLISKFLEEPLGEIFDKYKAKWFKDGNFVGIDAVISSMKDFSQDLNSVGKDFNEIWSALPQDIRESIKGASGMTEQSATAGTFETMSQDVGVEINGRAAAIQISNEIIKENTAIANQHLAAIASRTDEIRGSVDELRAFAIVAVDYLETIAANTSEMKQMNERLNKIEINTR